MGVGNGPLLLEKIMEYFINLPGGIQAAIGLVVFYILDAIVTKTPNPLDNVLVRGLKYLFDNRKK